MKNIVHLIDCMKHMETLPDNYYDLAIVDPPYNTNKAAWDKWKTDAEYIEFIVQFMKSLQRIMKENSSTYLFHNDFNKLSKIQVRADKETSFILRQFIVWNKRFTGGKKKGFLDGYVEVEGLRNYQKLAEYICYYTFQDETGLSKIMDSCVFTIREYIRSEILRAKGKIVLKEINKVFGTANNGGGVASAVLSLDKSVPAMITEENYKKLRDWLNKGKEHEYLRKEHEDLRKEHEDLRKEHEDLRYYYNNRKKDHSVWNYDFQESWHPTPKPRLLIENILIHSCRPNGKVYAPFNGSEIARIACYDMGFDFEGCELDPDYWKAQEERYQTHIKQAELFDKEELQKGIFNE